jgi:hypothetical protein
MISGRKKWWQVVALTAVGGGVIGGWFGLVRPQSAKSEQGRTDEAAWTRTIITAPPAVAEETRAPEPAPPTGPVTPVGGTLPIPVPGTSGPVAPAIPVPSVPVPSGPLPALQPAVGPRVPDAGLVGTDKNVLPTVPALPPTELPPLPTPPKAPEVKPVTPMTGAPPKGPDPVGPPSSLPDTLPLVAPTTPGTLPPAAPMAPAGLPLPAVPVSTAEPPKALPPPTPLVPPVESGTKPLSPVLPELPPPVGITPSLPPAKPADPAQPMLPAKSDSDLKPTDRGNTLNPTVPLVAPAVPIVPGPPSGTGREAPGKPVDRPKPPEPDFGTTDKFVFPAPVRPPAFDPHVPHQRDDTMLNLSTTAAFAVLGGALFAAEKASALPVVPLTSVNPAPGALVRAADPDVDKLKTDLAAANKKIEDLEKQVKKLTELLSGKRDDLGLRMESDPGAVEEIKRLKDKIATLDAELKSLKTQTALRPAVTAPEVKPKGIVKVVNEYPVEISMVINEKSYKVAPSTKIEVEVPAGEFTYQLLQSGAAATRSTIKDKETVTLRIK